MGADGKLSNRREAEFRDRHQPLFRERDRESMSGKFDLWSYDDVVQNADKILNRVRAGSMPCDGAWPEDRVALLAQWVDSGKAA
jgi:hypothetical protein